MGQGWSHYAASNSETFYKFRTNDWAAAPFLIMYNTIHSFKPRDRERITENEIFLWEVTYPLQTEYNVDAMGVRTYHACTVPGSPPEVKIMCRLCNRQVHPIEEEYSFPYEPAYSFTANLCPCLSRFQCIPIYRENGTKIRNQGVTMTTA